jgi:hypothetical protein
MSIVGGPVALQADESRNARPPGAASSVVAADDERTG